METIRTVIDQYASHGWQLRRAFLTPRSIGRVSDYLLTEHPDLPMTETDYEALWFSRRSLPDRETWELRRLSGSPFALVAIIEDSFDDDEREAVLEATQRKMFDGSHPEPTSH